MSWDRTVPPGALVALATLAGTWTIVNAYKWYHQLPLPPGPPEKTWLGGNAQDVPQKFPWVKFNEWAKEHGDVLHLRIQSKHIIVLSSYQAIVDLFESRGPYYSDRPQRPMAFLMGWENIGSFRSYDNGLKRFRRHAAVGFSKRASLNYHEGQTQDVHGFLRRLLVDPENFVKHLNWLTGSIIMRVTYGYQVASEDDPYITLSDQAFKSLALTNMAGNYLVDSYAFLRHLPKWLPGMGFKRQAQELRKMPMRMADEPFAWTKRQIREGKAEHSLVSALLEENKDGKAGEEAIKWSAASMYAGGSHTTVGTLCNFIAAMMLYPEVARKARQEMDSVIGPNRLPNVSDRPNLPYLECVLLETLRWQPIAPLAVPHCITRDDEYRGYRIPANSTVYSSIYAITRNERMFPDPEKFIPERFEQIKDDSETMNIRDFIFGIGRRICPGNSIADTSVYLTMAHLIATMDISRPLDKHGDEFVPEVARSGSPVNVVLPFQCLIQPRSMRAVELIIEATASTQS